MEIWGYGLIKKLTNLHGRCQFITIVPHFDRFNKLGKAEQYEEFLFTHSTNNIAEGPKYTRYKNSELNIRDKLGDEYLKELAIDIPPNSTLIKNSKEDRQDLPKRKL